MARADRAQDLADDLSPEEEAARYQEFQQFYADQAAQNQANNQAKAAADAAKAAGRDPALATLLQQLGGDNEATRAIGAALYDKYGLASLADLGRSDPRTVHNEGGWSDVSSGGDSGGNSVYTDPYDTQVQDWINKKTGEVIGRDGYLDLGYLDKDKVGTTYFNLNPTGEMGTRFNPRSHGIWDTGIMDIANWIPGINAYTIPLTMARNASKGEWGKVAGALAAQFLQGAALDYAAGNPDLLSSSADQLLGGAQTDSLDFNPGVVDATPLYDSLGYDWATDPNAITYDASGNPVLPVNPNTPIVVTTSDNPVGELARGDLTADPTLGSNYIDQQGLISNNVTTDPYGEGPATVKTRSVLDHPKITTTRLDSDNWDLQGDSTPTLGSNYIDQQGLISNNVTTEPITNAANASTQSLTNNAANVTLDGLDADIPIYDRLRTLGPNDIDQLGLTDLSAADRSNMFNTLDSLTSPVDLAKKVGNLALDTALEYPLTTLGIAAALAGNSTAGTTNTTDTTADPARRTYTYGEIPVIGPTQGIRQLQEASSNVYGSGPFRQSSAPTGGMSFAAPSMGQQYRPLDQYNPLSLLGGQAPGGQLNLPVNFSPMGVPQNITLEELIQSQRG